MDRQYNFDADEDEVIVGVPLSYISFLESNDVVSELQKDFIKESKGNTIMVSPMSCVPTNVQNVDGLHSIQNKKGKKKVVEIIPENTHYLHTHTFEQRRQNWIITNKSRSDGRIDYEYHHLETHKMFRSMAEIYRFMVYGEIPKTKKNSSKSGETFQVTLKRKPHIRGDSLIRHYVVGTCEDCNGVYIKDRREVNLSDCDIPSNIGIKGKSKVGDLYGKQLVNLEDDALTKHVSLGDAASSASGKPFYYLWDFELKLEAGNAKFT
ncbi:hypothetical protein FXO38_23461 [Capsicum annuum]|nr:hypothetical protein FXO38_23461 [Capsicum annuum]KAF3654999.1 hypothetical protein FXO37_16180 [Capsicum annuum]